MFSLDMRTAILSYVLITIISTFVFTLLLRQYWRRYNGVLYMLICFALQTLALIFILLRGIIPAWISFDLSNTISVAGIMLFYIGLESYIGKKSSLIPNIILLILFALVHTWFTFGKPDLAARHLNVAIVWLLLFLECTWLLLFRVSKSKVRLTMPVSFVCFAFCLLCIVRIAKFFIVGHKSKDYFESDMFDTVVILVSQVLLILLIFSLEHMFGRQLLLDIKAEEEKFSKAFNTSPYGIIITRFSNGEIIEVNKGFQEITGFSSQDISGKTTSEAHFWLTEDDRNLIIAELHKNGIVHGKEFEFRKKSGESATCLFSSVLITINNETCVLSSVDDISERKKFETELIASREKAVESDKLKTAFMSNMSHEIRTPLNAIVGFSTLLCEPDIDSGKKGSYIEIITKSSDHLLNIVNDIMEISTIEAGIVKLKRTEINLNNFLNEIYTQFKPKALEKGIDLNIKKELPDRSSDILVDDTKLGQVLSNLLNNALKFTDAGRIEFGYEVKNDFLKFYVKDTGIGIPDDMHDKIFDRFYQVNYSSSRPYEGIGLGLSICKAYIELSGGRIWPESNPAGGTTFYFILPYIKAGRVHTVPRTKISPERLKRNGNKTLLIAEDVDNNYLLLNEFLSSKNINIIRARNGKEAIEICKSGDKIDLVLMDIKMPVMNGLEATGALTELLPDLPVIALTTCSGEMEKNNLLSGGCIDYISKPCKKADLIELVNKYL